MKGQLPVNITKQNPDDTYYDDYLQVFIQNIPAYRSKEVLDTREDSHILPHIPYSIHSQVKNRMLTVNKVVVNVFLIGKISLN